MTSEEILKYLKEKGSEATKKVLMRHGAKEPFDGVKVADLKILQKKIKKDHDLAIELYNTGNSDAMYLAGLIADETKMTKANLQDWVEKAYWYMISEYTVPFIAAETEYGLELAREWIKSDQENIASAGWATYAAFISVEDDANIDIKEVENLLNIIDKEIHSAQNRVKYTMNGFVIASASYIASLTSKATEIANQIGKVDVYMGGTSCKVPHAPEYIKKIEAQGKIGKKHKKVRR